MLAEVIRSGIINNLEAEFFAKDRSKIWTRFDTKIYPDKGYMEDVVKDITDRKHAEEALKVNLTKYQTLFETLPFKYCFR